MSDSFKLDIDLDREGRHDGYLRVKASSEHSPFGISMVPITSIRRGAGPCIIVIGGCHGDEYEGQLIARSLLACVEPESVTGQIIVLPAANPAAVRAGRRYSPADNGNLNTAFPGKIDGTATQRIARFMESVLLPRADLVIDIHSGGKPVQYFPSVMLSAAAQGTRRDELVALVESFGLPVAFFVDKEDQTPSSILGACDRAGVLNISAEIGGGGCVQRPDLDAGLAGILRVLGTMGVLSPPYPKEVEKVSVMRRLPVSATVLAPQDGLFEPRVELGDTVEAGALAGFLHDMGAPWKPPAPVFFTDPGFVLCRRLSVVAEAGDGLFKLAVPMEV
ncbi:succinylglutamate desuccinylase/aspartoacylase family protein [Rhizobium laguerreae]|uniref:succinylglutamate desuccinylase/aspartoacylase family protein n=1 Tax=Rhizobium laguerreae TaxID=1076926 RepID=UPI0010399936|nr:succinylglutamate desuccinylase/aspartoacylase family protein [Rhizobium laguerreae]TBX97331.1 deacylase [Rhizobium laguerreae]